MAMADTTEVVINNNSLELRIRQKETGRQCGDCQLCCKLLPVTTLDKGANQRCRHQRVGKGCMVYRRLEQIAPECRLWSCAWLVDPEAAGLRRPDRGHYVVDTFPDFILQTNDAGEQIRHPVIQVWLDPAYPDAHRDSKLRAYIEKRNMLALIRIGSRDGFILSPPGRNDSRQWHEHPRSLSKQVAEYETWPEEHRRGLQQSHARYEREIERRRAGQ
jgi:hypothetical protein